MSVHNRPERVGQLVQELLGELFARGMRDPRIGLVTITGVKMSPDLREARVYWAVHGEAEQRKQTAKGLEKAKGFLRREIALHLKLRVTPEIHFKYDEAIDRGARIEQLIREVHEQERETGSSSPGQAEAVDRSKGESE